MNCLSVFDHFVELALKGVITYAKFPEEKLAFFISWYPEIDTQKLDAWKIFRTY